MRLSPISVDRAALVGTLTPLVKLIKPLASTPVLQVVRFEVQDSLLRVAATDRYAIPVIDLSLSGPGESVVFHLDLAAVGHLLALLRSSKSRSVSLEVGADDLAVGTGIHFPLPILSLWQGEYPRIMHLLDREVSPGPVMTGWTSDILAHVAALSAALKVSGWSLYGEAGADPGKRPVWLAGYSSLRGVAHAGVLCMPRHTSDRDPVTPSAWA